MSIADDVIEIVEKADGFRAAIRQVRDRLAEEGIEVGAVLIKDGEIYVDMKMEIGGGPKTAV